LNVSCAILAGGQSRRMGSDKATINFRSKSLIRHVYDVAKKIFDEITIVTSNHPTLTGINGRILRDILPIRSPMVGILTALIRSSKEYTFILACDMPFVTERSLVHVLENLKGEDIVIPKTEKGFEPLHAIYSKRCIPFFLKVLDLGRRKIQSVFPYVEVKILEDCEAFYKEEISIFTNINTKEDLQRFAKIKKE